jgi:flavin-dependent dehydrogenase
MLSDPRLAIRSSAHASAWASDNLVDRSVIFNPYGAGLHLDRTKFEQLFRDIVLSHPQCVEICGTFTSIKGDDNDSWLVAVKKQNNEVDLCHARWVVDATGRKATVASKVSHSLPLPRYNNSN